MSKKDIFGDESSSGQENDFGAMLERSLQTKRVSVGDSIRGEILSIGKTEAFISTGTPVDGAIPLLELLDEQKQLKYKVGDIIEVKVVRMREGEILLRRKDSTASSEHLESLEDAFDMEIPVEGTVIEQVKGGFRVKVQGKLCFCPISQMDSRSAAQEPAEYIGKKYEFIITQFENGGRNIVVSRRKVLDLKKAEFEGEFMEKRKPGDLLSGRISRLEKYGAFVTLEGGVEALIPISELAWGRIQHPSDVVKIGQDVSVSLLRTLEEDGRLKISVSFKQAGGEADPWVQVTQKYPVGTIAEGTVERKETYGFFVALEPGISGLLPRSKWRDRTDGQQYENKKRGDKITVQIDEIQYAEHRLTFGPPDENRDESWRSHAGQATKSGLGTLGDLLKNLKR
jgi:small subunit ribosomal protein S1